MRIRKFREAYDNSYEYELVQDIFTIVPDEFTEYDVKVDENRDGVVVRISPGFKDENTIKNDLQEYKTTLKKRKRFVQLMEEVYSLVSDIVNTLLFESIYINVGKNSLSVNLTIQALRTSISEQIFKSRGEEVIIDQQKLINYLTTQGLEFFSHSTSVHSNGESFLTINVVDFDGKFNEDKIKGDLGCSPVRFIRHRELDGDNLMVEFYFFNLYKKLSVK